jgi:hypothetical protein
VIRLADRRRVGLEPVGPEQADRADRAELLVVTDQPNRPADRQDVPDDPGQASVRRTWP